MSRLRDRLPSPRSHKERLGIQRGLSGGGGREVPPHVLGAGKLAKGCAESSPFTFHSTLLVPTKALRNPFSLIL